MRLPSYLPYLPCSGYDARQRPTLFILDLHHLICDLHRRPVSELSRIILVWSDVLCKVLEWSAYAGLREYYTTKGGR